MDGKGENKMNRELVDELMTWSLEAILKPDIQRLHNIKQKALQARDQQLVEFCDKFEKTIQNKQPIQPIFTELLATNNRMILARAEAKRTHTRSPEDLEI